MDDEALVRRARRGDTRAFEALVRLKEHNKDISILIIIPKESGSEDPGYEIVDIANRVGIKIVSVKKVKDP